VKKRKIRGITAFKII